MTEQIISFETAKLARQNGFTFNDVGDIYFTFTEKGDALSSVDEIPVYAPTQSVLQKWLRDEHKIHIEILLTSEAPYEEFYYRHMKIGQYFTLSHYGIHSDSYEEALENALRHSFELIK